MKGSALARILVVGDSYGVPELLKRVDANCVVGIISAAIRPQHHLALQNISRAIGVPLLTQPLAGSPTYSQFLNSLLELQPDSLICHSYAMLVRPDILELVAGVAFNVHAALLPRNRGPNPVQWALINGEKETGVTLHMMSSGFDNGAIVDQEKVAISDQDTWVTLSSKLHLATDLLLGRVLPLVLHGEWRATPQNETDASHNRRILPDGFEIKFGAMSDRQIFNLIRAQVAPLKGAYLSTKDGLMRLENVLSMHQISDLRRRYE